jgi:hypothetical protein
VGTTYKYLTTKDDYSEQKKVHRQNREQEAGESKSESCITVKKVIRQKKLKVNNMYNTSVLKL